MLGRHQLSLNSPPPPAAASSRLLSFSRVAALRAAFGSLFGWSLSRLSKKLPEQAGLEKTEAAAAVRSPALTPGSWSPKGASPPPPPTHTHPAPPAHPRLLLLRPPPQPTCTRVRGRASCVNARVCARTSGGGLERKLWLAFATILLPRLLPELPPAPAPLSLLARGGMRWAPPAEGRGLRRLSAPLPAVPLVWGARLRGSCRAASSLL